MTDKLKTSQQRALVTEKPAASLGCVSKSPARWSRRGTVPLCLALVGPNVDSFVLFWALQCKNVTRIPEGVQQRATRVTRGLEHTSSEERLGAGLARSYREKGKGEELTGVCVYFNGGYREESPGVLLGMGSDRMRENGNRL